jgi:hypothetical protein
MVMVESVSIEKVALKAVLEMQEGKVANISGVGY